ncbi:hypothetical protein [Hafnia paralvei]|uniref:hypothetical protein n=2 Tax=Hafnia paralvei TaxID=546367 RepID=UPI0029DE6D72|nr:hypothetical protein [Hafnia paralvei]
MSNMSKKRSIGRMIARAKAIANKPDAKSELEMLKTPPKNRTEAKKQLALKLKLVRSGALDSKSLRALSKQSEQALLIANALRFDEGLVDPVSTDKTSDSNKRWRGRTAD